jgi:FkbM family methyltransferase
LVAEGNVDSLVLNNFFKYQNAGLMIDVGAARPDFLSIGAGFRARGWRVISIEPNPDFAQKYRELGFEIYECACSNFDADGVDFVVAKGSTNLPNYRGGTITAESFSSLGIRGKYEAMLSTLRRDFALQTIKVKVRKLDTILGSLRDVERIDVLSVDVEGWELECLKGFSFGPLSPRVAIVENLFQDAAYRDFMSERGYGLWRVVEPNEVYVLGPAADF